MNFYTADTHFYGRDILLRENRPFNSPEEFVECTADLWNNQISQEDVIYHLGDFINYNYNEDRDWIGGLNVVKRFNCKVILIIGNNEERLIEVEFESDFNKFKSLCTSLGFTDVLRDLDKTVCGREAYLNHYPRKHKNNCLNLFGHTHRTTGLWKPYGLNVGCDLNHFRLFSEYDIFNLLAQKDTWWDKDKDNNCMN